MHDLFADPAVDIVLNLTRPYEHFEVSRAALLAGKHVYSEKPLAADLAEGRELVRLAEEKGLLLGGAPDTFLGAGLQTCRRLIDDGYIGEPVGAAAFMICRGHESWHPDPDFYYQRGGGPLFDMGPYYLTALVNLLGGVSMVSGMARASFPERLITSQPHRGETIHVHVPTYVAGLLQFASGAVGTLFTTFDVHYWGQARLEVYGAEGTLVCPDPNGFAALSSYTVRRMAPGGSCPSFSLTRRTAGPSAWLTWPRRCAPAGRSGQTVSRPSTSWKSWSLFIRAVKSSASSP